MLFGDYRQLFNNSAEELGTVFERTLQHHREQGNTETVMALTEMHNRWCGVVVTLRDGLNRLERDVLETTGKGVG